MAESTAKAQGPKKVSLCPKSKCETKGKMAWPPVLCVQRPGSDPRKEKAEECQCDAPDLGRKRKKKEPHPCI